MMVKFQSEVKRDFFSYSFIFHDVLKSACNGRGNMAALKGFVHSQRWCKNMKYGSEANVTQDVGNFVAEVNLLDQLSTFHLIKAPLPASRSLATAK